MDDFVKGIVNTCIVRKNVLVFVFEPEWANSHYHASFDASLLPEWVKIVSQQCPSVCKLCTQFCVQGV